MKNSASISGTLDCISPTRLEVCLRWNWQFGCFIFPGSQNCFTLINSPFFLSHTRSIDNPKSIVRTEKNETIWRQNKQFRQAEIHFFCLPQHMHLMEKLEDATIWQQISGEVNRACGTQRLFSEENRWQRRLEFSLVPRAGDHHTRSGIFMYTFRLPSLHGGRWISKHTHPFGLFSITEKLHMM